MKAIAGKNNPYLLDYDDTDCIVIQQSLTETVAYSDEKS